MFTTINQEDAWDYLTTLFKEVDEAIIQDILYVNAWHTPTSYGKLAIFKGIDNSLQMVESKDCISHGNSFDRTSFSPVEISYEDALKKVKAMISEIESSEQYWKEYSQQRSF